MFQGEEKEQLCVWVGFTHQPTLLNPFLIGYAMAKQPNLHDLPCQLFMIIQFVELLLVTLGTFLFSLVSIYFKNLRLQLSIGKRFGKLELLQNGDILPFAAVKT